MTSQQVIRNYLVIAGLYTLSASVIWGVNTLFLLDAGLNISEVFIANAAFTAGMVLFEIPTGVVADTQGRRASFLLSAIILMLSTFGYVAMSMIGAGIIPFVIMSIFLGLGFTFYSGAVEAWLVDALNATNYEGELDQVFARGSMITGGAMLIGSVGGGIIGTLDLSIPFIVRGVMLGLLFVYAYFTMHDIGYEKKDSKFSQIPKQMRDLAQDSITYGWREPHIRLLMIASLIQSGFMMWAFYAWQPYLLDLWGNPDAIWISGFVAAAISISTIVGNLIVERIITHRGKRTTVLLSGLIIFIVAMVGVGLAQNFWLATGLLLVGMGTMGLVGPVRQSYIHHVIPSDQRATVLSVDSMFASGGGIFSQVALGELSLRVGIAPGYVIGGLVSTLCIPLIVGLRRLGGEADIIVGDAGHQGACAAQGISDMSGLDAKPRHEMPTPEAGD